MSAPRRRSRRRAGGRQDYRSAQVHSVIAPTAQRASANRQQQFKQGIAQRALIRRLVIIIAILVVAIIVAFSVGSCTYVNSVSEKMKIDAPGLDEALVEPESSEDPYFMLLSATFADPAQPNRGPDVLMLIRVDEPHKQLTLVSIPSNLVLNAKNAFFISETQLSGDAELVKAVADFADVDIVHYLTIDANSFVKLVDGLGGVEFDVTEEVDDPDAGAIYIEPGQQTLDGAEALTFCRANNYLNGDTTRAKNQMAFLEALTMKAADASGITSWGRLDELASSLSTDMNANEAMALMESFGELGPENFYSAVTPGYTALEGDELYFYSAPSAWASLMEVVKSGGDPSAKSEAVSQVDPSQYSVTVLNGSGVAGGAEQVATILRDLGYEVGEPGNTASYAYDETLVVYKEGEDQVAAEAIVDALGVGRVVTAGIYYSFDTDLQVIVGRDWRVS